MGTFSPETCLELVQTLTRQQVDREYIYFGGTIDLPTKDKRFKLREYLVTLRDAQKTTPTDYTQTSASEYAAAAAASYNADRSSFMNQPTQPADTTQAYMYQNSTSSQAIYSQPQVTPTPDQQQSSSEPQLDSLHTLCHQINANVIQLKSDLAEYARGRAVTGAAGDAVDMDLSDPGEDMEMSDCDMDERGENSTQQRGAPMHSFGGSRIRGGRGRGPPQRGPSFENRSTNGRFSNNIPQKPPSRSLGTPNGNRGLGRAGWTGYDQGGGSSGGAQGVGNWIRDQPRGGRPPQQPSRDSNPVSRVARVARIAGSRGSQNRRDFGVRGLGNKEEIPHDLKPVDWESLTLEEINRVNYNAHSSTANRTKEEIDTWRDNNKMTVSENCPNPILQFDEVSFPNAIKAAIKENRFTEPTPIQAQGWPIALSGRDLIGIAQTGSGKTLGFTLPGLVHINAQPPSNDGPIALCLCPTRELAQQVMEVCEQFTAAMRIRAVCLYGGSSKYQQTRQLSEGVEFAIATPGRLIDLLNTKRVSLRRCSYLVVDEADRMLDMGFEPQITAIISQIRPDRQTLMWSATWPKEVQELAMKFLQDPLQINIGSEKLVANHAIKQVVQVTEDFEKFGKLKALLQQISDEGDNKTLVFTDTKRMADDIAAELKDGGWPVESMHGDKRQEERERILGDFKRGYISILVATDVASRGIDISDITNVINFDYPNTSEDYIHRIGRTARASRKGTAYTFITPNDSRNIDDLVEVLKEANQEVPHALMMMRECFGGTKPEKKVWVPKHAKRKMQAQAREAETKRIATTSGGSKPLYAWDDPNKEDSDSDVEVRKRQNCPETDDDWAALYGDMGDKEKEGGAAEKEGGVAEIENENG